MKASIAVLPGDGIGPEVTAEAVRCLVAIGRAFHHDFEITEAPFGGASIDACGEPLSAAALALCQKADAVLLGAIGGPKWADVRPGSRPEQGLLSLRRALGVYANLRPVKPHPAALDASPLKADVLRDVDIVVVRELTGGIYFGEKTRTASSASDLCRYTAAEIERVALVAGRLARGRRTHVTSVDKENVLATSKLWREVVTRVFTAEFPDVRLEHMLVDTAAMALVQRPRSFDVLLTENMFGDILTDEASTLAGSMGLLPSASLGDGTRGLYEPIHGSAPDIAGQGVANPCAAILSVAMLLRLSLHLEREAAAVELAVHQSLERGRFTRDLAKPGSPALSTRAAGDAILEELAR
ncbi:MAG TPA: 3-isopropylmalate dehydrogenase [Steroidobacteraceae bacterium]|nr:3-isopropylmalate dehydrogenase [Steroidobacteraceae bacterium]